MITISLFKTKLKTTWIIVPAMMALLVVPFKSSQATPIASFSANQTSGCAPLSVKFTSTSSGAASYYWVLGNGNTSTLTNASNLYTIDCGYTVTIVSIDA